MKYVITCIGLVLFSLGTAFGQKYAVNESACSPTDNSAAWKIFNKIEKEKDGAKKKELLEKAVEVEPDFYEALFQLGIRSFRAGNYDKSRDFLNQVITICPDYSAYTYYMLGWMAYYEEDYITAEKEFDKFFTYDYIGDKEYMEVKEVLPSVKALAKLYANPVVFDPKPVGGVSSNKDEYLGSLTPDNRYFYYIRKVDVDPNSKNRIDGAPIEPREIFMMSKNLDGNYDSGSPLTDPFNKSYNNGAATITADNKEMYFVICDQGTVESCDIWVSRMENGAWGELKRMDGNINSGYWDSQPSVSYDGSVLIFASNRPGGFGKSDLYISTRRPDGGWTPAQNMGDSINTPESEISPFLHSDSQTLYFSSQGHPGMGDYDIFYTRKTGSGAWEHPMNLGYPINNKESDVSFFVSLDGKTGFYASSKLDGPGGYDIYSFTMPDQAKPAEVYYVEGTVVKEEGADAVTSLEIKNLNTTEVTKIQVDSTDGKYVAIVAAKDEYILSIKQEDVAFESTLINEETASAGKPVEKKLDAEKIEVGGAYRLNDVNFGTNSYELSEAAKTILTEFGEFLKLNPKLKVAIHGHTDNVGNANDNLLLSQNRAKAVYEFLVSLGLSESKLSYKGFGSAKPLVANTSESGRAQNRRTEFVIER